MCIPDFSLAGCMIEGKYTNVSRPFVLFCFFNMKPRKS